MKRTVAIFSIALGAALAHSPAQAICALLLESQRVYNEFYDHSKTGIPDPVSAILSVNAQADGSFLLVRNPHRSWNSSYGGDKGNPHFDPRALILWLGAPTARKLGFELLNAVTLRVPSAEQLNAALNRHAQADPARATRIRFYTADSKIDDLEYLSRFAERGEFPLASDPEILVHDLAFHVGSIFLPTAQVELARVQTRALLGWITYIRERTAGESRAIRQQVELHIQAVVRDQARTLDNTGLATLDWVGRNPQSAYLWGVDGLTHHQVSPAVFLRQAITPRHPPGEDIQSYITAIQVLKAEMQQWIAAHPEWTQQAPHIGTRAYTLQTRAQARSLRKSD